ncbi:MAG: efflux transporter outer membrane subunit [Desulforhabdus sp.]|jgi:multidrug efflux system outer membrane protein|nr:efflux transporter outer membrane subunit [Desulforhabdus sp.]
MKIDGRTPARSSSWAKPVAAALTLVLLSGCAVGPNYQRPEATPIPETYAGPTGEWKTAAPKAHLPKGRWWEMFNDPELNRLESEAEAANQDLKAAAARFEQARALADVARSGLFPRLGTAFLPLWQRDSENRPVGGKPRQTYDSFTVPFDLSYELDLWGRVRRTVEASTAQKEASAEDVESVRLAMQAEIAADYLSLRALDADRALLLSSIEVYRKSLELVLHRRAGGMVSDLDVAQAETVLKITEAQLPDNALQRAKFQNALAVLTGKNASLFRIEELPLDVAPLVVPPGLPSELLERRPDIAAAERRMAAANAAIGVATAAFFPTFKFNGLTGFQSGDVSTLIEWPSRLWAVGPSLTLPLFQGGQLTASLHQAKAVHEETVAKYRQTVLTAFAEVENNLAAQHLLANEYEQELTALQSARKLLEVSNNRYRAGLVTYLEVATAQNAALGTERACVRLRGQQLVAVVALIKSLGGGWRLPDMGGRES